MTFEEINILGDIVDTTWGKSSTAHDGPVFSSCKVRFIGKPLDGDIQMEIMHTCVLSFGTVDERNREMKKASRDADAVLEAYIKSIKEKYKTKSGKSLKVEVVGDPQEDWTLLNLGQFSGRRDCYFIKKLIVEVS